MYARRFATVVAVILVARGARAGVYEPGPEAAGAVAAGADALKAALKVAKGTDKMAALYEFQQIADHWPAALHDCYLALASLRAGDLTEAKLAWDRSATRGGDRPKWCTGDLVHQLDKARHDRHFVELVFDLTPRDALVNINNIVTFRGFTSVWWPTDGDKVGTQISAPGYLDYGGDLPVPPPAPIRIALEPVPVARPPHVEVDAGVAVVAPPPVAPPDAGVTVAAAPDAAVAPDFMMINGRPISHRKLALGAAIVGAVGAATFGGISYFYNREQAKLAPGDPAYNDAKDSYEGFGITAIACAGLSVLGASLYIYYVVTDNPLPAVAVRPNPNGFAFGGVW